MTLLAATAARAEFGSVEIAPVAEALTFARTESGGGSRLILISSYAGGLVSGIDATEPLGSDDPIDAYRSHGYESLAALNGATVNLPVGISRSRAADGIAHRGRY